MLRLLALVVLVLAYAARAEAAIDEFVCPDESSTPLCREFEDAQRRTEGMASAIKADAALSKQLSVPENRQREKTQRLIADSSATRASDDLRFLAGHFDLFVLQDAEPGVWVNLNDPVWLKKAVDSFGASGMDCAEVLERLGGLSDISLPWALHTRPGAPAFEDYLVGAQEIKRVYGNDPCREKLSTALLRVANGLEDAIPRERDYLRSFKCSTGGCSEPGDPRKLEKQAYDELVSDFPKDAALVRGWIAQLRALASK